MTDMSEENKTRWQESASFRFFVELGNDALIAVKLSLLQRNFVFRLVNVSPTFGPGKPLRVRHLWLNLVGKDPREVRGNPVLLQNSSRNTVGACSKGKFFRFGKFKWQYTVDRFGLCFDSCGWWCRWPVPKHGFVHVQQRSVFMLLKLFVVQLMRETWTTKIKCFPSAEKNRKRMRHAFESFFYERL